MLLTGARALAFKGRTARVLQADFPSLCRFAKESTVRHYVEHPLAAVAL